MLAIRCGHPRKSCPVPSILFWAFSSYICDTKHVKLHNFCKRWYIIDQCSDFGRDLDSIIGLPTSSDKSWSSPSSKISEQRKQAFFCKQCHLNEEHIALAGTFLPWSLLPIPDLSFVQYLSDRNITGSLWLILDIPAPAQVQVPWGCFPSLHRNISAQSVPTVLLCSCLVLNSTECRDQGPLLWP